MGHRSAARRRRWSITPLPQVLTAPTHKGARRLDLLREKGISYVVCGESSVDLAQAVDLLGEHFGIRTLLLEGGGHINGAFLEAGLVDEVSLLLVPGIDGRREVPAVFDGVNPSRTLAVALKLQSVEPRAKDALWLRYEVVRS